MEIGSSKLVLDMQECKVFFKVDATKEDAEKLFSQYGDVKIENFMPRRQIGCNEVTYAIVTIPVKLATKMLEDKVVDRIDIITTFRGAKPGGSCGGGGCGGGG